MVRAAADWVADGVAEVHRDVVRRRQLTDVGEDRSKA